jgi:hypothetical protein
LAANNLGQATVFSQQGVMNILYSDGGICFDPGSNMVQIMRTRLPRDFGCVLDDVAKELKARAQEESPVFPWWPASKIRVKTCHIALQPESVAQD